MNEFDSKLKSEITDKLREKTKAEKIAALSAVVHAAGSLVVTKAGIGAEVRLDDFCVAYFVGDVMKECGASPEIEVEKGKGIKPQSYIVKIFGKDAKTLFDKLCIIKFDGESVSEMVEGVDQSLVSTEQETRAYLAGVLIGAGTVNIPTAVDKSGGYHLEIRFSTLEYARDVMSLLAEFDVSAKCYDRENAVSVYVKESQAIADILAIAGADECVMELQNMVVLRSVSNNANRQRNCNVANIDKSVTASGRQIATLTRLFESGIIARQTEALQKTAQARIDNPFDTLDELAEKLGISKSAINHRLRKLESLSEEGEDK